MSRVELAHTERGTGRPLVLLHAFPLSSAMWQGLELPCRVIAPDQRGFGGSPLGADPPSLGECADDVLALMDRLGLEQVALGGLSMGGYVAMELLRRAPGRVSALLLADTKAQADTAEQREGRLRTAEAAEREGTAQLADQVLPALLGGTSLDRRLGVVARVRDLVAAAPPATVAWASRAMAGRPDSFDVLRATQVPALVVVGEQDVLSPVAQAQQMADALPQGRLVVVPEAGHLSAVEDPEAFGAAVTAFLDELG
ncbi:MAG: hydrolase, alpha/beta fold family [Frankiales bacterium]|nr:hydrolase, alpha/beta fold family [Frankiales bacterium]